MRGPTCIFWANLTPFSLKAEVEVDCSAWTGTIRMTGGAHAGRVFSSLPGRSLLASALG
jgi:hypothetical protein